MPLAAEWSLQKAVFSALTGDATLTGLIGSGRVHDDVPQGAAFPYLTLGQSVASDWSTASEGGTEHVLTLHV